MNLFFFFFSLYSLWVFHTSFKWGFFFYWSDSRSPYFSRTHLSILTNFNCIVAWIVSILPLITIRFVSFSTFWGIVSRSPIIIPCNFLLFSSKVLVFIQLFIFPHILCHRSPHQNPLYEGFFSCCLLKLRLSIWIGRPVYISTSYRTLGGLFHFQRQLWFEYMPFVSRVKFQFIHIFAFLIFTPWLAVIVKSTDNFFFLWINTLTFGGPFVSESLRKLYPFNFLDIF